MFFAIIALAAAASQPIYRCETQGKIHPAATVCARWASRAAEADLIAAFLEAERRFGALNGERVRLMAPDSPHAPDKLEEVLARNAEEIAGWGRVLAVLDREINRFRVPVITPGRALAADDSAQQFRSTPYFVALHPIVLNKAAFGSNVLTVVVGGKQYRFVGAMMRRPPLPPGITAAIAAGQLPKQIESRAWSGHEPGGGTLVLSNYPETAELRGSMFLRPARNFRIETPPRGTVVLVETDANVAPALIYAAPDPSETSSMGPKPLGEPTRKPPPERRGPWGGKTN